MTPRRRIALLILIMSCIVCVVGASTICVLYHTALDQGRSRLQETARSLARLIEAVSRFDQVHSTDYPAGARQATIDQIRDAHASYEGFGKTGEITLSRREGDQIVFLLSHRHHDLDEPQPVPWTSELAEPMRHALSGESGTIIGLDYRGALVLAAHEPVQELDLGIVAKIDLAEIRAPFVRAGILSALIAIPVILAGVLLFLRITNPILQDLRRTVASLEKALGEVKTLRGILPICSYCKRIRDDDGAWNQLEVYVEARSDADFSHSICPSCMKEHHREVHDRLRLDG
jgi:hypothetical protein